MIHSRPCSLFNADNYFRAFPTAWLGLSLLICTGQWSCGQTAGNASDVADTRPTAEAGEIAADGRNEQRARIDAYPNHLSPRIAEQQFRSAAIAIATQQRQAMQASANELERAFQSGPNVPLRGAGHDRQDSDSRRAAEDIVSHLRNASDMQTALSHVMQLRSRLPVEHQGLLERTVDDLAPLVERSRRHRLAYQTYLNGQYEVRWSQWSLETKRERMWDYLALSDERPKWLLQHWPVGFKAAINKTVERHFYEYETARGDLLRSTQRRLVPHRETAIRQAHLTMAESAGSEPSRGRAEKFLELMSSRYGRDLRGLMLCPHGTSGSSPVDQAIDTLVTQWLEEMKSVRQGHVQLIDQLKQRLSSQYDEHLHKHEFRDLMLIDLKIGLECQLWRPLRIFARRSPSSESVEDAWLIDRIGHAQYRVEFLADHQAMNLSTEQLCLEATDATRALDSLGQAPIDGPGVPVDHSTELKGQLLCHSASGWQAVHAIDYSPFGIVVQWEKAADPVEVVVPRHRLRLVPEAE